MKKIVNGTSKEAIENRARLQHLALWSPNRRQFLKQARHEGYGFFERRRMANLYMPLG